MSDPVEHDFMTIVWRVLFMAGCSALSVGVGIWRIKALERAERELFRENSPVTDVKTRNTHYLPLFIGCVHVIAGSAALFTLFTPATWPVDRTDRGLVRFAEIVSSGPAVLCGLFTVLVVLDEFLRPWALELRRTLGRYRDHIRRRK